MVALPDALAEAILEHLDSTKSYGVVTTHYSNLKNLASRKNGIQNGAMATGLAINVLKSPVIALGSAVFGPWSAITSSILASRWQKSVSCCETAE